MKKVILTILVVGLFVAAVAVPPAWSQGKKVNFSLNAGVQTDIFSGTSFDKVLFTLDARAGIRLGSSLEISPEVMVVFNYLSMFGGSGGTLLYPGAMLNYRSGNFFVGVGAILPWAFFEGSSDTGHLAPKVNIGYTFSNNVQITAYYLCWTGDGIDLFDAGFAGLTLGYRF
jgi:hypothetical protein